MNRFAKEVEACKAMSSKTLFRKRLALLLNKNRELCCAMLARGFRKLTVDSGFEEMKGDHMPAPAIRVLVVEDSEPFRKFICSTVGKRPELQIVGEVSDGLQAVQKAEELQPDLILLDIGLPTLGGIEVAQRIRKLSPESRILFVSQNSSVHVVQGALAEGAKGYVVKTDARRELLTAVDAVLRGRQYVSSGLSAHNCPDATGSEALDRLRRNEATPSLASEKAEITRSHEVAFCSDDAAFVFGFTRFIEAALQAGNAVVVIATESHRNRLLQRLQEHGVDIAAAIEQGRYVSLDVAETLSTFMVNGLPDPARCLKVAGDLVMEAAKAAQGEPPRVAVCGEIAPSLWAQGKADAAIQVEHLWDEIAKSYDVDILCG
ncbi:MAG: response regulator [Terriglobales bacterium]